MRIFKIIVSIGLLAAAVGLSPAVSFDGTRTPGSTGVGVPLPDPSTSPGDPTNVLGNAVATAVVTRWEGMLEVEEPETLERPRAPSHTAAHGARGLELDGDA